MISVVAALVLAIVMTSFGYSDDCSFGHPLLSGQFLKSGGWPLYIGSTVQLFVHEKVVTLSVFNMLLFSCWFPLLFSKYGKSYSLKRLFCKP